MPYDNQSNNYNDRGDHGNFQRRRFSPQAPVPVKEGDVVEVTIEGIGEKGDGIAKIQGFVIIVPHTQQGQRVKIKVTAVRGKVSFGEVVERLGEGTTEEQPEMEEEAAEVTEQSEETAEDEEDGGAMEDDFGDEEEQ